MINPWGKWGNSVPNKKVIPIHPIWKYLLNMILIVTHLFKYINKMAKRSWYSLLQLLMTMGKTVAHNPGHIQFINSIDDDQYDMVMSCNNVGNRIIQKGDKDIVWELKGVNKH